MTAVGLALPPASLQAEIAYVANVANANVSAYRIGAHGSLTSVPGSPFPAGIASISVAVDILGRFVYVANFAANSVSAYHIAENGALMPVSGSPFPAGSSPSAVAVDHLGRFVYVANGGDFPAFNGSVSAYRIAENGSLTPITGSPFPAGRSSSSVAVDHLGRFVYVANAGSSVGSNNVSAYRLDDNGSLIPVPGSPFPVGNEPESVAFSP